MLDVDLSLLCLYTTSGHRRCAGRLQQEAGSGEEKLPEGPRQTPNGVPNGVWSLTSDFAEILVIDDFDMHEP